MKTLVMYLEKLQGENVASTMTFHMDSPFMGKPKKRRHPVEESIVEKNRLMIDFDKTIYDYAKGWDEGRITGDLLPDAKESIDILKNDFEIVIYSSRFIPSSPTSELQMELVSNWLTNKGVYFDGLTGEKLPADAYIDDKAVRFKGNWKDIIIEVSNLKIDKVFHYYD